MPCCQRGHFVSQQRGARAAILLQKKGIMLLRAFHQALPKSQLSLLDHAYPKFSGGTEHAFESLHLETSCCKVSPLTRQMDTACSCSSIQTLLFALFGFFTAAHCICESKLSRSKVDICSEKHSSLVRSQKSEGQTKDSNVQRWFLLCSRAKSTCRQFDCGTQTKRTTCSYPCGSSIPADTSCSSFLLSLRRCFLHSHPHNKANLHSPPPAGKGHVETHVQNTNPDVFFLQIGRTVFSQLPGNKASSSVSSA